MEGMRHTRNTFRILMRNDKEETTWENETQMRDNNNGSQTILFVGYLITLSVSLTILCRMNDELAGSWKKTVLV